MSKKNTSLSRRSFLRGAAGVVVALPFLESLTVRGAWAGDDTPATRMVHFFTCNGVYMDAFWPSAYGSLTAGSFAGLSTEPLGAWADKLLVPRGIHMVPKGFGWDPSNSNDHGKGMAHKLTAQPVGASGYATGISVDQHAAGRINPDGAPALVLKVGPHYGDTTGHCSYLGDNQPVTGENNPWLAYRDLVGLGGADPDTEALQRLTARRESVLDLVRPEYERLLSRALSRADRDKLDMHFTAIRDLETGITGGGVIPCHLDDAVEAELEAIVDTRVGYDSEYPRMGRLMMDITALAIACGANRVVTLQWSEGAGGPIFDWDGIHHQYSHHKLSHGNTADDCSGSAVAGYEQMLFDIDRWYASQFAYLLEQLDGYTEADGSTVLDNTAVVWANELSHGKDHDFRDLPYVLAGSCGGWFRTGEYVKVTEGDQWGDTDNTRNDNDASHNKLLVGLLNAVGVTDDAGGPVTDFGHPDFGEPGELDGLRA